MLKHPQSHLLFFPHAHFFNHEVYEKKTYEVFIISDCKNKINFNNSQIN